MKFFIFSLLILIFISCSNINRQQREYYESQHPKFRHGIIPLGSSSDKKEKKPTLSQKLEAASVERGKAIYVQHCLSCHGDHGRGDGPLAKEQKHRPMDLQKTAREVSDFKFFMSISQWQGDMPGWRDSFNEAEREDLVAYIKSLR